jgi:hypothetical protein
MLEAGARVALTSAALRVLPYCVASSSPGREYEDADSLMARTLAGWMKRLTPPAPGLTLTMLTAWVEVLRSAHTGQVIRALLEHPGAADVIASLLTRGQVEAAVEGAGPELAAAKAAWGAATEALGQAFVEAG